MRFVSKEAILNYAETTFQALYEVKNYYVPLMMSNAPNETQLCTLINEARSQLEFALNFSTVTPVGLFSAHDRDVGETLTIVEGQMLQLYICGKNPDRPYPAWVEEYEKAFAGKKKIEVTEWEKNRGLAGVRQTTSQYLTSKIESENDLINQLLWVSKVADDLEMKLLSDVRMLFKVQLEER